MKTITITDEVYERLVSLGIDLEVVDVNTKKIIELINANIL